MKPILFNTEMVRAILDGRKTVTRRVVKPQPEDRPVPMTKDSFWPGYFAIQGTEKVVRLPYQPGDILWVRETWAEMPYGFVYRVDGDEPDGWDCDDRWRPSIHMPRGAARIFLRVTGVRVERLQEITAEGALDEGTDVKFPEPKPSYISLAYTEMRLKPAARQSFSELWDSTIKPKDRTAYGWEANPWVWVIEFERIRKDEANHDD